MSIETTTVKFLNTEGTVTLQGDQSIDSLRSRFSAAFTWISNASVDVTQEGNTKIVTFSESTARKG